jgi:hypothetical protein
MAASLATKRKGRTRRSALTGQSNAALAFAEAETRSADHILEHIEALHTELDMLRASGDYHIERGFSLPARTISHLPDMTARSITAVARSGFTVTAVHAGDDTTALAA